MAVVEFRFEDREWIEMSNATVDAVSVGVYRVVITALRLDRAMHAELPEVRIDGRVARSVERLAVHADGAIASVVLDVEV